MTDRQPHPSRRAAAVPTVCAACGRSVWSPLSIAGACATCGAPLCLECVRIRGRRHCQAHQPAPSIAAAVPGPCPILPPVPAPDLTSKLGEAQAQLQRGEITCLVTATQARALEVAFLGRFDQNVQTSHVTAHPLTGEPLAAIGDWAAVRQVGEGARPGLYREMTDAPRHAWHRYTLEAERRGGLGLILEARVVARLGAFARDGLDTVPFTLADLLPLLDRLVRQAEADGILRALSIASVTGWTDEAARYVSSAAKGFRHPLLLVCLVDLLTGDMIRPAHETRWQAVLPLLRPTLLEEELATALPRIESRLRHEAFPFLSLAEAAQELGLWEDVARAAFERLAATGDYVLSDVPGVGRTLQIR